MQRQRSDVVQEAKRVTTFWIVPKEDLPKPLPKIAAAMVSEEQLIARGAVTGAFDFETNYVLHRKISRADLPDSADEVQFVLGARNTYSMDDNGQPQAPGPADKRAQPPARDQDDPVPDKPAAIADDPLHRRGLKRNISDLPPEGDLSAEQRAKRNKELMRTLTQNINDAVARQSWWDEDPCANTVFFWAQQCLLTVTAGGIKDTASPAASSNAPGNYMVLEGFCKFLANIVLDNPVYIHIHRFVPFFEALKTAGARTPSICDLIVSLSKLTTDSNCSVETGTTDLDVRTRFFTSVLWGNFVSERRQRR
jgi:hypothetical protein